MTQPIKVPALPESVADAVVLKWHKQQGESVSRDEVLVELETDKVVLEVPALTDGVLSQIDVPVGQTVKAGVVLGSIAPGAAATASSVPKVTPVTVSAAPSVSPTPVNSAAEGPLSPAVRRVLSEQGVKPDGIQGTGKGGRLTRQDVAQAAGNASAPVAASPSPMSVSAPVVAPSGRVEERVPMSRLRARIAERLLSAQEHAALLTTFNEVNMHPIMQLRARYKDDFERRHGIKLGLMSFFVKASVEALKRFPAVNAFIDGSDIVYHGYCDVGVAVSTDRGLVVPILRDAQHMSFAQVEQQVAQFAQKARSNQLSLDEMTGGTFTITNGGVFGSLLATPIINPPQSAILGMHKIQDRPIAEQGQVVIRPMMYIALTYDHRMIDGKESVQFLVTIKELLESPEKLLLDL